MLETIIFSVTAFIVTIGPIDVSLVFLALTAKLDKQKRKSIAIRGTVIAAAILIFFLQYLVNLSWMALEYL